MLYEIVGKDRIPLGKVMTNRAVLVNVPAGDHRYVVSALNNAGESEFSMEVFATVTTSPLAGSKPRLDRIPPVSSVDPLPEISEPSFPVRWFGFDEPGGSGLEGYDVHYSVNGGPYQVWKSSTTLTGGMFPGSPGNRYSFYCVAIDEAGNRSATPDQSQAETMVPGANTEPWFESSIGSVAALVGDLVTLTNRANDLETPADRLRYHLCQSDSSSAYVDPDTGVFVWFAGRHEARRTNRFTVCATDSGVPAMTAQQSFEIVLPNHLELEIGSAVVSDSLSATLPITVFSTLTDWTLSFDVQSPVGTVEKMILRSDRSQVCGAEINRLDPRLWHLDFRSCPDKLDNKSGKIGQLDVRLTVTESQLIPLRLANVRGHDAHGERILKIRARPGRIAFIADDPLLEANAVPGYGMALNLYGRPGRYYGLEIRSGPEGEAQWEQTWDGVLPKHTKRFFVPVQWSGQAYFRAWQVPVVPPY